jgi:branched-subunit amino acid aminotransferase/4-amino-4-deoxychorismate lyase
MTVVELPRRDRNRSRNRKSFRRLVLPASESDREEARLIRELRDENARLKQTIRALIKGDSK